jgi:CYTH domain-containing protein
MLKFQDVPWHDEIERRFLLEEKPDLSSPMLALARPEMIVQTYLGPIPGWRGYSRIRATTVGGKTTYLWTAKKKISPVTKSEAEAEINAHTYNWLLTFKSEREVTEKIRRRFKFNGLVHVLDHVQGENEHWLLEVELDFEDQEVLAPPCIGAMREVTYESLV